MAEKKSLMGDVEEKRQPLTAAEDLLNPETEAEGALTALLLAHPNRLDYEYAPNPYEHLPSRLLSMLPSSFISLTRLGLNSAAASVRNTTLEGAATKRRIGISVPGAAAADAQPKRAAERGNAPLTGAVARSFDEAAKINLDTLKASTRKTPTAVYDIIPDVQMAENIYATASSVEAITAEPGAFFLTHPGVSQTCLYGPAKKAPNSVAMGRGDIFGVPMEMYNIQSSAHQAPKRWLLFAKEDGRGSLCEVTGKRFQLVRERGLDVAENAMIHLKVDRRRGGGN